MWSHEFDSRKRHCWPLNTGKRVLDGSFTKFCKLDHSDDPKVVGKVEWMRFIHSVGHLMGQNNPFTPSDNGGCISLAEPSVEQYFDKNEHLLVTVDLRNRPVVVITTTEEAFYPFFDEALKRVEESYA